MTGAAILALTAVLIGWTPLGAETLALGPGGAGAGDSRYLFDFTKDPETARALDGAKCDLSKQGNKAYWEEAAKKFIYFATIETYRYDRDQKTADVIRAGKRNRWINAAYSQVYTHLKSRQWNIIFLGGAALASEALGDLMRDAATQYVRSRWTKENARQMPFGTRTVTKAVTGLGMAKAEQLALLLGNGNKLVYLDIFWQAVWATNCVQNARDVDGLVTAGADGNVKSAWTNFKRARFNDPPRAEGQWFLDPRWNAGARNITRHEQYTTLGETVYRGLKAHAAGVLFAGDADTSMVPGLAGPPFSTWFREPVPGTREMSRRWCPTEAQLKKTGLRYLYPNTSIRVQNESAAGTQADAIPEPSKHTWGTPCVPDFAANHPRYAWMLDAIFGAGNGAAAANDGAVRLGPLLIDYTSKAVDPPLLDAVKARYDAMSSKTLLDAALPLNGRPWALAGQLSGGRPDELAGVGPGGADVPPGGAAFLDPFEPTGRLAVALARMVADVGSDGCELLCGDGGEPSVLISATSEDSVPEIDDPDLAAACPDGRFVLRCRTPWRTITSEDGSGGDPSGAILDGGCERAMASAREDVLERGGTPRSASTTTESQLVNPPHPDTPVMSVADERHQPPLDPGLTYDPMPDSGQGPYSPAPASSPDTLRWDTCVLAFTMSDGWENRPPSTTTSTTAPPATTTSTTSASTSSTTETSTTSTTAATSTSTTTTLDSTPARSAAWMPRLGGGSATRSASC